MGGTEVVDVGQQHQLAVEGFGVGHRWLVDLVGEALCLIVGLDETGQLGLGDGALKAAVGTAITGAPAALCCPFILGIELRHQRFGELLQLLNARAPLGRLIRCAPRIMRHHQPMLGEAAFGQAVLERQRGQRAAQLDVAARRHR